MTIRNSSRPIARVFRATAAPGCRDEPLQRFHSSSAALVNSKVGCLKYRILEPVDALAPEVVFESIWRDLDAVKVAFGDAWQQSGIARVCRASGTQGAPSSDWPQSRNRGASSQPIVTP
jgi:quinol monooxygenase YgiN